MSPADTTTNTNPAGRTRLYELDLLRFLAATAVVLYHFTGSNAGPWGDDHAARELHAPLSLATQFGYLGVELFFLISGFVILMSAWGRGLADFTVSRVTRLYPAYWFSVALVGAIYLTTGLGKGRPENLVPNLTMFQRGMGVEDVSGVYWTLWVEMHFYALIALLVLAGTTYRNCVAFMGAWTVLALFADETGNQTLEALLIPGHAPYFIAGMAFYLIHRFGPTTLLWGIAAFSWAVSIRHALPTATGKPYDIAPADAWPAAPLIITALYATIALVATGRLRRIRWRRLATLGALTYPTYLIHYEIGPVIARHLYPRLPLWAATVLLIAAVFPAAYLIHRLIERPAAAWLKPRLRDSFDRVRLADRGLRNPARTRPATAPAAETEHRHAATGETTGNPPSDPTPRSHEEDAHGSTSSAPIGSTI
ncbi:acyltransferase [Actinomadura rubrobrunea]|uniref:Acyltransferase n=1 Tax=Actinomadura rubrobrunea TaxID=115335 RepID=A0A9W6PXT1_9ACTN|nr:acyltransferase [Actinomadura rubrobrunea]GLW64948.1 acyltransferase [Actinomadura rubrobrunea]